jgi:DHA2 family multidrug resistance protein
MTDTTATPESKPEHSPMLIALVVSLAAFMEVLDTTITNVSLSHIAGSLAASQDESTWVLTSYLVANGIVLPLSGWLSGVMGRKKFFMVCIAGFTLASFACGMATSLPMLIVFRLFQGLAGGGLQPTQQAIITDSFPPEKRGTAFAITGITMIVAPILGPTLGGFITDNYDWRWIFFMNIPVGIFAFFMVGRIVPDTEKPHANRTIDYIGLGLVAIGLAALQIVLDKGQEDDWFSSPFILTFAIISAVCLISGAIWIWPQERPIVDLKLMKIPSFGLSCVVIFFVGLALYGCSTLLPLLLQSAFGYDATLAGLVLSPGGIAIIFLMPVAGKLVNKIQARYLISFGMFMTAFGVWLTAHLTPQTNYGTFVMMRIAQVAGLPFLFVPTSALAFTQIPREKSSNASALFALMRNLGGSLGISLLLSHLTRHEQIHQNYLSATLSPGNIGYRAALANFTTGITQHGVPALAASQMAFGKMYQALITQATILSYVDTFQFISVLLAILGFLALLMPPNELRKKAGAEVAAVH